MFEPNKIFHDIFHAKDEEELDEILKNNPSLFVKENWKPLGDNFSNYGVVKNQQSNPIAALIEKITNSIDAILMKKCYEKNIDPRSSDSPRSMEDAIKLFFEERDSWDLLKFRKEQAEEIQIIADGKGPRHYKGYPTSVIIYDNGEGQHPEKFEGTFLSLLKGNKNDIHFVQGKYNMGGSGSIVFCGKHRYQLIASKRYDNKGDFGFTLVREHPKTEDDCAKETWYEYWVMDNKISSFPTSELDLGLEGRKFKTGTIIKLFSYQFPKGYSAFSQDLNQSINEYLYSPALPILTRDTELRYPNNKVLQTDLYGLRWRLQHEEKEYLEDKFSEIYEDELFGKMKVSGFVFKTKIGNHDLKRTKEIIQDRYFKNGMSVLFSINGQVHGHYTSEFITRALKLNLLKSHLLIHVDCTEMKYNFRKELFMASRDRLKDGEETQQLRAYLAKKLSSTGGRLSEIEKRRKQAVEIDTSSNTSQLLKDFTKNLPFDSELMKLLNQTFKLDIKNDKPTKKEPSEKKSTSEKEEKPFNPQHFPGFFKLKTKTDGQTNIISIPIDGEKTILFNSDVENDYFDRTDEPGELKIALLGIKNNETNGGTDKGKAKDIKDVFNVTKSSPNKGNIRLSLNPKDELKVGDEVQIKVSLNAPGQEFEEIFWVKIADQETKKDKVPKLEDENEPLGLPPLVFAYKDSTSEMPENSVTWSSIEEATGMQMGHSTTMVPEAEGDNLKRIFVNMESGVLMNFKKRYSNPNQEQIQVSHRKYYTSVYFHTLFLYSITKNRGYEIHQKLEGKNETEPVELGQYLKDLFDNYYSTFILNFGGANELMQGLGD